MACSNDNHAVLFTRRPLGLSDQRTYTHTQEERPLRESPSCVLYQVLSCLSSQSLKRFPFAGKLSFTNIYLDNYRYDVIETHSILEDIVWQGGGWEGGSNPSQYTPGRSPETPLSWLPLCKHATVTTSTQWPRLATLPPTMRLISPNVHSGFSCWISLRISPE